MRFSNDNNSLTLISINCFDERIEAMTFGRFNDNVRYEKKSLLCNMHTNESIGSIHENF